MKSKPERKQYRRVQKMITKYKFKRVTRPPLILSFGAGVNSIALYLHLIDRGLNFEAVFCDHGAEYPETYNYLEYFEAWLERKGLQSITHVIPEVKRGGVVYNSLYDFCIARRLIPQQFPRWCTDDFKITQINRYSPRPAIHAIGIAVDERQRADKMKPRLKSISLWFPFVEEGVTREGCKEIIRSHGLEVPPRSKCWFCPFQRKDEWVELRRNHPDLFQKAIEMEKNADRTFHRSIPLEELAGKKPARVFKRSVRSVHTKDRESLGTLS